MARRRLFRSKRPAQRFDELGGRADGGLAILGKDDGLVHMTTPAVGTALRYFLARVDLHESAGLPGSVAMTSALRGEGVTYITRSLASVIAYDTDRTVVVVDTNWTDPKEGDDAPLGLADMVERGADVDDVLVPMSNPHLCIVPAGAVPVARRPHVVGSDRLADTLDELSKRFDHMLLDLAPVLASSQAMSLSQYAESFVFVVRQGATAANQVEAALEEMRGSHALGVVLNRFESSIPRRLRRFVGT